MYSGLYSQVVSTSSPASVHIVPEQPVIIQGGWLGESDGDGREGAGVSVGGGLPPANKRRVSKMMGMAKAR